jgi:two-component system invasion response regulator UvrY
MEVGVKVMLVDDHAVVRMGFKLLLEAENDTLVVAEAESAEAALRLLDKVALSPGEASEDWPDVVVMDLAMPGMGGLEGIKRLKAKYPSLKVLALSAFEDSSHPKRALQAGAWGYLSKRSAPEALLQALQCLESGQHYLDATTAQRLALNGRGLEGPFAVLSAREFDVFLQLAHGKSVTQISEALSLSGSTVGTHLYNIKQKLKLTNQAEMTLLALRHQLIDLANA